MSTTLNELPHSHNHSNSHSHSHNHNSCSKLNPLASPEKRSVAKKACLSCREKKIKCDGELVTCYPDNPSAKTTTYKTCSNCKAAGIECIFVPSKRGGKRKKKSDYLMSGLKSETSSMVSFTNSNVNNDEDDDYSEVNISNPIPSINTYSNNNNNNTGSVISNTNQSATYYNDSNSNAFHQQQKQHSYYQAQQSDTYDQLAQAQVPSQQGPIPPWIPYGLPVYPDANGSYQPAFAMQQQQQQQQQQPNNYSNPNSTSNSKVDSKINSIPTQQIYPPTYPLKDNMVPPGVNVNDSQNKSQTSTLTELKQPLVMNYMYPYQYPYFIQDPNMQLPPQQQQQQQHQQQHQQQQHQQQPQQQPPPPPPGMQHLPLQMQMQMQHQYQYPPYQQPPHPHQQIPYYQPPHPFMMQSYPPNYPPENPYQMNKNFIPTNNNIINNPPANRQMKFVDFEDKNSSHYLKKKIAKESDSVVSSGSSAISETRKIPATENESSKKSIDDNNMATTNTTTTTSQNHISKNDDVDDDRDNDSWSVSLAPSDSVTMIQSKRKRLEMMKYENKFQAINETEYDSPSTNPTTNNSNNGSYKTQNNNGTSNHYDSSSNNNSETIDNSSLKHHTSSVPTSHSNSYNVAQKVNAIPEYAKTEVSTTERWVADQNNELKRNAIATEQEMKELHKRQKKYQPLQLDVKCPKFINEQLLESLKLPDMQTLYKLIGVYYKYYHPHTLILPNMSYFVSNLTLSNNSLALLAAMFKVSARYMSHNEVSSNKWLDESYWENLYNSMKDKLTTSWAIITSLIQCSRGDDEYINNCIHWIKFANLDQNLVALSWSELEVLKSNDSITSSVLLEREIMIRSYWNAYKGQVFRRLSFGFPYDRGEKDEFIKLNKNIELPLPDIKYYKETETLENFKKLYNKNLSLTSISTANPDGNKLFDSACAIVSLILLEEVLDSISNKTLFSYTILRFSHRLNKNFKIHDTFKHLQPYQLETHPEKEPHIIVNASNFSSTFMNRMTALVLSIGLCNQLLAYAPKSTKPFRSQLNPFNDSGLVNIDPKFIVEKSNGLSDFEEKFQNWTWFFKGIDVVYDMLILLQLGDGVCSATLGETKPIDEVFETVIGPCCAGSSVVEEWCVYNTWTMNVSNVPVENQGWIQMSTMTVWGMAQAWSFLSSLALYLKVIDIELDDSTDPEIKVGEEDDADINLSENEDDERKQVTGDAGRIDSEADFKKKVKRENYNLGGTCNIDDMKEYKDKKINIIIKATGEKLVTGLSFNAAPTIFSTLLKNKEDKKNSIIGKLVEKMKIIRKYLGIMEKYHGDCKIAGVYCDKVLDYIIRLANETD